MLYLILARNRPGPEALATRQALRAKHVETVGVMADQGSMQYGGAILAPDGTPAGSVAVVDFATRSELDLWLRDHPYRAHAVWGEIEIWGFDAAPAFIERLQR